MIQFIKAHTLPFTFGAILIALISSLAMNIAFFKGTILLPENSCGDLIESLKVMQPGIVESNKGRK